MGIEGCFLTVYLVIKLIMMYWVERARLKVFSVEVGSGFVAVISFTSNTLSAGVLC
jgi:hypothetical protein